MYVMAKKKWPFRASKTWKIASKSLGLRLRQRFEVLFEHFCEELRKKRHKLSIVDKTIYCVKGPNYTGLCMQRRLLGNPIHSVLEKGWLVNLHLTGGDKDGCIVALTPPTPSVPS